MLHKLDSQQLGWRRSMQALLGQAEVRRSPKHVPKPRVYVCKGSTDSSASRSLQGTETGKQTRPSRLPANCSRIELALLQRSRRLANCCRSWQPYVVLLVPRSDCIPSLVAYLEDSSDPCQGGPTRTGSASAIIFPTALNLSGSCTTWSTCSKKYTWRLL